MCEKPADPVLTPEDLKKTSYLRHQEGPGAVVFVHIVLVVRRSSIGVGLVYIVDLNY